MSATRRIVRAKASGPAIKLSPFTPQTTTRLFYTASSQAPGERTWQFGEMASQPLKCCRQQRYVRDQVYATLILDMFRYYFVLVVCINIINSIKISNDNIVEII